MRTMMNCPACGETISIQLRQGDAVTQLCPHCGGAVTMPNAIAELPTPQIPGQPDEQGMDSVDLPQPDVRDANSRLCRAMPWLVSAAVHCAIALLLTVLIVVSFEEPIETFEPPKIGEPTAQTIIQRERSELVKEKSEIKLPDVRKSPFPVDDLSENDLSDTVEPGYGTPGYAPGTGVGGGPTGSGGDPSGPALFGNDLDCIIYVIDRSGSMHGSFADVQDELRKSISRLAMDRLDSQGNAYTQQFHVILFADGGAIEIGGRSLADATDAHKIRAIDELSIIQPLGQTDPLPALRKAFAELKRAPDGKRCRIELLTDGSFPDNAAVLALVDELNGDIKAQVNTVLYGNQSPQAAAVLHEIARRNGGRYKYVSPDEL